MPRLFTVLAMALVALLAVGVPTSAAKQKKASGPKVTKYSPTKPELGGKLVLYGKGFAKQRKRNTVVLRAPNGGSTFLKPSKASRTKLVVRLRNTIDRLMRKKNGVALPTRFRVRVLAGKKFGPWTAKKRSPVIRPGAATKASEDCDKDGLANSVDEDDDNDLLTDTVEKQIKTDLCLIDTDTDGAEDGFEYQSALDLNDDEDQEPNTSLPYPGKRPYPNPLDPADVNQDFDGDTLVVAEEQALWHYSIEIGTASRTLTPLSYSAGEQYSINVRGSDNRRHPNLLASGYSRHIDFLNWASNNGYRNVMLDNGPPWYDGLTREVYGILDFNRDGTESASVLSGYKVTEVTFYDHDLDGWLSDDERDEDADGLPNYEETHGRMSLNWWSSTCYSHEKPFKIPYEGTYFTDPDTDGDGIRDGADDQDHDDVPNVMELSRIAASGLDDRKKGEDCKADEGLGKGNFSVIGGPLPSAALTVTFEGLFAGQNVPQMTVSNGLVGGTVSVATIQQGGPGGNEEQTVTINGAPTGGNFTLTFSGETTTAIAYNADAAAVDAALEAILGVEEGTNHPSAYGRVNPFNPCLPATWSRTCPIYIEDDTGAPFDDSMSWLALN